MRNPLKSRHGGTGWLTFPHLDGVEQVADGVHHDGSQKDE